MPLEQATRLGVYEVLGPLGAGGMGEVYRARDTRLGRDVAIKVLPEGVARDASRLARFEREARFLASLNHPGIAAVYGFEEAAGVPYIVMELVPGETLTAKLTTGALSLEESLSIARQIAEALEAAHEKGVLHRDLKPANIKVTPEGRVKVLDLGLAKAFDVKAPSDEDMSRSPTVVLEETRPGVILGTAEFMSPEQARGKAVDKRTDIWAFGCVFFEMLSGRRAFTGETVSDVLVAILGKEPDWSALPRGTPPRVRELLGRCLEKDVSRRLRDIGDARLEIEEAVTGPPRASPLGEPKKRGGRRLLFAAAAAVALIALWIGFRPKKEVPPARSDKKSLAVLFRDLSGKPNGQFVADGISETVGNLFAKIPGLQVVTPSIATVASRREADPYRIARELGANLLLLGKVQREGDRVRITYAVYDTSRGESVAADTVDGSASDIFDLQDRVFASVANELQLATARPPKFSALGLDTAEAQDRYLEALGRLQRYESAASVQAAIGLLEPLVAAQPRSALGWAALARAFLYQFNLTSERKWIDQAEAACARARELDPGLAEVDITLGEIRTRTGRPREAVAAFERALARAPSSAPAVLGLADAYEAAGDLTRVEQEYRRAIALLPEFWAGYNRLGNFYFHHGQTEKAADMFRQVVRLTPDNVRGHSSLGAAYQLLGKFEDASAAYRKSLALDPTADAYSNLGTLEYYLGRYASAAEAFEKAVAMRPGNYLLWANLGDAYRWIPGAQGRAKRAYEQALTLGDEALRVNPKDTLALATLAACFAKQGQDAPARKHIGLALDLDPRNTNTLYQAAVVANLGGRSAEALDRVREAVRAGLGAVHFQREPELQNLRTDEDFQKLLRGGSSAG